MRRWLQTVNIHPTACIEKGALLDAGVEVGPYSIVGGGARIGEGTRIGAFSVIEGRVSIGRNCTIGHHVVLGAPPQDVAYRGEDSEVVIGDNTVLREFVTIHRATGEGKSTRVGNNCFIMAYCHIAHNCEIGDEVTMANGAALAGYVTVGPQAVLSGYVGVHQFVRIGRLAMVGGLSKVVMDVPPFLLVDGHPAQIFGLNVVGLRRRGFSAKERELIKRIYRILYHSSFPLGKALEMVREEFSQEVAREIVAFFEESKRGVLRWRENRGLKESAE